MGPFVAGLAVLLPLTLFRPSRWVAVAWCWLVAGYLAVVIGPRAEPHYLITGFASLAVVVGIVCEAVFAPSLVMGQEAPVYALPAALSYQHFSLPAHGFNTFPSATMYRSDQPKNRRCESPKESRSR